MATFLVVLMLNASFAFAWPRPGLAQLAGAWVGCYEGDPETLHIRGDGYISITDASDQDIIKTYCDSFKRVNGAKYILEDLFLICPETDGAGNPDPSTLDSYPFHFLDRDHVTLRPYFDEETYIFRRASSSSHASACAKGTPGVVRRLAERLLGPPRKR
jgi:hypothetical protein